MPFLFVQRFLTCLVMAGLWFSQPSGVDAGSLFPQMAEGAGTQALVGVFFSNADSLKFEVSTREREAATLSLNLDTMPFVGIAGRRFSGAGGEGPFGLEAGFLAGWKSKRASLYTDDRVLILRIENSLLLLDFFAGGCFETKLTPNLKAFAGTGPLILAGFTDWRTREQGIDNTTRFTVDGRETATGLGWYLRGGMEFQLADASALGFQLRYLHSELDLGDVFGKVPVRGVEAAIAYSLFF